MAFKKLKLYFDGELAILLSDKILVHQKKFKSKSFIHKIKQEVEALELKDRVEVIADQLFNFLGEDFKSGIAVLSKILGEENEEETGMFKKYYWIMPIAKYVEKYGLDEFELSMDAIMEITKRNTGEYSIRPFLEKYPKPTLKVMAKWAENENKHVRRLSSEGLRPRLPWALKLQQFIDDPKPILPILTKLRDDPSKYVQKSVANCLNDVLKDNLEVGKTTIEAWSKKISKKNSPTRFWIIKHALRNLVKKEDDWALDVLQKIQGSSSNKTL